MDRENRTDENKHLKISPFKIPDGYFNSFEEQLQCHMQSEFVSRKVRIIRFIKPALGLAAGFALIFVLVYVPLHHFSPEFTQTRITSKTTFTNNTIDTSTIQSCLEGLSEKDDNSFYNALNNSTDTIHVNWNKVLPYLSSEMDDYEIYAETLK